MPFSAHRIAGKRLVPVLNAVVLLAASTQPATAANVETAHHKSAAEHNLALGKTVFSTNCLSCHGKGAHGAPRRDSASDWKQRLEQNQDTLARHAIDGHGQMPPKGGFSTLSDAEVEAAVAYVVDRSQKIIATLEERKRKSRSHPVNKPDASDDKDMEDVMTLHMLWLLGSPAD
jgi:cytochrome c5